MKLFLLYINLISYFLFFNSRFTYSEDLFTEPTNTNQNSEFQSPSADSDTYGSFDSSFDTKLYGADSSFKNSGLDSDTNNSGLSTRLEVLKFYSPNPNNKTKLIQLGPETYTLELDENNKDIYHYEFKENVGCTKIKYDNTTIWRSGEFGIDEAKFIIYSEKNDRIVIRDDSRSITYRLIEDDNEQTDTSETVPEKQEHPEKEMFGSYESSVTYVTYVNDPVILSKRSRVSRVLLILTLFAMLFLITTLMVGLILMVLRVYRVVDQVKLAVYHNEHEKMMI